MQNFETKFSKVYQKFKHYSPVGKYNKSNELEYYADYFELVCIFSNVEVTEGSVYDRIFGEKEYDVDENDVSLASNEKDKDQMLIESVFQILAEREELYGLNYPFNTNVNSIRICEEISNKQIIYINLLISSMLDIFKSFTTTLTTGFEKISSEVLKNYLPKFASVKDFGLETKYKGNTENKIRSLLNDIGLTPREELLKEIPKTASKEKGCDIAAWIPFNDSGKNKLIFICQSTCQKDFKGKYQDTVNWLNYIENSSDSVFVKVMFLPFAIIEKNKTLFSSDKVNYSHLNFERKRILEFVNEDSIENIISNKIVNKCIEFEEPIV